MDLWFAICLILAAIDVFSVFKWLRTLADLRRERILSQAFRMSSEELSRQLHRRNTQVWN